VRKILLCFIFFLGFNQVMVAQKIYRPHELSYNYKLVEADEYEVSVVVDLDAGWYVYSMSLSEGGPVPTFLEVESSTNLKVIGTPKEKVVKDGKVMTNYDRVFEMELTKYSGSAEFSIRLKVIDASQPAQLELGIEFMVCNAERCLNPKYCTATYELKGHSNKKQKTILIGKKQGHSNGCD
jgi:thiol:disulfide interchange protein DsbD